LPRLTKRTIDAIKSDPSKDTFAWCSATPGFGARVYPSGRIVFIAQVRVGRGQRRVKIGTYGPYTVEQARAQAEGIIRAAAEGRDPQREKQERREALTVSELCDEYIDTARAGRVLTRFGRPKKASTLSIDFGRVERHIKPLIGRLPARELTTADVQRMTDAIAAGKTATVVRSDKKRGKAVVTGGHVTAARVTALLGGIWSWAAKRGHVAQISITKGLDRTIAPPRDRTLSPGELRALGNAIDASAEKTPAAAVVIRLLALTGARREEIVGLKRAEIDLAGSCLQLGNTKTGRSTRPLGNAAVGALRDWLDSNTHPTLVFPSERGDRPADLKKAIANIFDAAGLLDARSHTLRRTFASIGDEIGFSEATIGDILGHARRGVTNRHYIRRPDAALVAAATRIADRVAEMMAGKQLAEVVPLRQQGFAGAQ
jgi:integrase